MSLTNPNNVVTEERLSEFYQAILPYLGGMPDAICNKFDKANFYSNIERVVGCDTTGRPVYQKVVFADCGNATNITMPIGSNIRFIMKVVAGIYNKSNMIEFYQLPWTNKGSAFTNLESVRVECNNSNVMLNGFTTNWTGYGAFAIVQYSKTTDAANSFKYADENDYSTNETIVGSWIDGKPLYQKTIDCGAFPNSSSKQVNHNISNIDKIVCSKGDAFSSTSGDAVSTPYYDGTNLVRATVNKTRINLTSNFNASSYNCYFTMKYTKTTD